jgi:phage tail-like protein
VRIDADVPAGTSLEVSVSTSEKFDKTAAQGDPNSDPQWKDFPAGWPHSQDWQKPAAGATDFLIQQPPGRYLFLRMRLTGDGHATPLVRRIQIDLPRSTSLEFLPAVYRDNPRAEDFTERFLSLFDAAISDLDRAIDLFPGLLDEDGVPDEVLPWLGSFLDVIFESGWSPERRRRILRELPKLYHLRGTVAGLRNAIKLIFDVEPSIQELGQTRSWGGLGHDAPLNSVRLFGRARARFRLGASALSRAPIRSFGNPDRDPIEAGAYRFRLALPVNDLLAKTGRERLQRLVESQKPAHTLASITIGGSGWILGTWSQVGVNTSFAPLPAPVLGSAGNVRLNRMSVLWSGPRGRQSGVKVGRAAVGLQTVME